MIADDAVVGPRSARIGGRCSRRDFLGSALGLLAASSFVGGVAGGLAGCAYPGFTHTVPNKLATPATPLIPSRSITVGNAAMIVRLATLKPMDGSVRGVAWSPDGRIVATGSDHDVSFWDVATGQRLEAIPGHSAQIYSMAWSRATNLLASASSDGSVKTWDMRQGHAIHTLVGSSSGAIFTPPGQPMGIGLLVARRMEACYSGMLRRGSRPQCGTGRRNSWATVAAPPFASWGVAWSPDGRHIVSTRYDDLVLIWDVATGQSRAIPKTDTQPNTVAWSPDGRQFALTDDQGKVILWNGANAQRVASFEDHDEAGWAYGLAWSPDGSMVASSRESGILQVWDVQTGKELVALQGHANAVWGLAWSPDGLRLASASDDETVRLWGAL